MTENSKFNSMPARETIVSPEKEKAPVEILLVDDKYAPEMEKHISDAANSRKKEDEVETNLKSAVDLKGALANLDAVTGNKRAGVITDLYFPKETGSDDWSEGDKILDEICAHYKLDQNKAHEILKNARDQKKETLLIINKILDKTNCTKEQIIEKTKEKWLEKLLENYSPEEAKNEITNKIEYEFINTIYELGLISEDDIRSIIINNTSIEDLKKRAVEKNLRSMGDGLRTYAEGYCSWKEIKKIATSESKLNEEQFSPLEELFECLVSGDEANQPLGIRVAEEAHKRGIPVIICTSHHAIGQKFVPLLADYLKDKNILSKSNIFKDIDEPLYPDDQEQLDVVKKLAKDSGVFLMFKGVKDSDPRTKIVPGMWGVIYNELINRIIEKQ